jgi:hypothetical protein
MSSQVAMCRKPLIIFVPIERSWFMIAARVPSHRAFDILSFSGNVRALRLAFRQIVGVWSACRRGITDAKIEFRVQAIDPSQTREEVNASNHAEKGERPQIRKGRPA